MIKPARLRLHPGSDFAALRNSGWEADERPEPRSLGLLPSGPDPVGEWLVHRQPPDAYIGRWRPESKREARSVPGRDLTDPPAPTVSIDDLSFL